VGWQRRNFIVLAVFAPVLILTGILGFVLPPGPMSGAHPYNYFHIAFGAVGVVLVLFKQPKPIAAFNFGFGLIDLWQAVAGIVGKLFPDDLFALKPADHVLHIVIGALLVVVGYMGLKSK
jgi:hypothetical protein